MNDAAVEAKMQRIIGGLEEGLARHRAGRAHPSVLESVVVSYYGNPTPLSQVATVLSEGPSTLVVKPWEKGLLSALEKGIQASDVGVNPVNTGEVLRIVLPPLSEERRKELVKKVRTEGEHAKVSIRNVRRDANQAVKDALKAKACTEDSARRSEETTQKLTDKYIEKIDRILSEKEADLMAFGTG